MTEKELRYDIIFEACTKEEFFVLVSSVDHSRQDELTLFLKVLVDLTKEGLLQCEKGETQNIPITEDDLCAYVRQRRAAGEPLNEYPEVCDEYVFTTTDKGVKWLDEQYGETKRRAARIIGALERYKQDHSVYPPQLNSLCPEYLQEVEPPVDYHGYWRYEPYDELLQFKLEFGSDINYSIMHSYDSQKRKWDFDE